MNKNIAYSLGVAAIVLTVGSVALAAAPAAPPTAPTTASGTATKAGADSTWTAPAPTPGDTFYTDTSSQPAQYGGGYGMMRSGYGGGYGGGYGMMRGRGYATSGNVLYVNRAGELFPLIALAGGITLLLAWAVLILMIIALVRHLRKKV